MTDALAIDGGKPTRDSFLPFGVPNLGDDEIEELVATVRSGWIGTGPRCLEFERRFAAYVGAEHAVAVNSCTSALHLALLAAGVGRGHEVIVPAMTFAATANVVEHVGARVRFVDVDPTTFNVAPAAIAAAVTPRTRAAMVVHFGGLSVDLAGIRDALSGTDVLLIEDAAHAVGAETGGQKIGAAPSTACFSFYPNKNMTTGEGGMVVTPDGEAAERMRVLRLHGLASDAWRRFASRHLIHADAVEPGFKYNMTDLQAALGLHQLRRLPDFLERRERIAAIYDRGLAEISELSGLRRQPRPTAPGERHALHLYSVLLPLEQLSTDRDGIMNAMLAENIGVALHYRALHTHSFYRRRYHHRSEAFPVANDIGRRTMTLPISASMTDDDAVSVLEGLVRVLRARRR